MIELIKGLPDAVVGLEAVGEVDSADYKTTAAPEVRHALERHPKIRLIHVLDDRFTGYTAGGAWQDALLGNSSGPISSIGFAKPKRLRGGSFSSVATQSRSIALCTERSVPFGKYWRSSRLVFSHGRALPRCVRVTEVDVNIGRRHLRVSSRASRSPGTR